MDDGWLVIFSIILPTLAVVCFGMMICRLWVVYQKERSVHTVIRVLVSFTLTATFVLYSLNARKEPIVPTPVFLGLTTAIYTVMAVALAVASWCEWMDLLAFLRKKNTEFVSVPVPEIPATKPLVEVAEEGSNAALVATEDKPA